MPKFLLLPLLLHLLHHLPPTHASTTLPYTTNTNRSIVVAAICDFHNLCYDKLYYNDTSSSNYIQTTTASDGKNLTTTTKILDQKVQIEFSSVMFRGGAQNATAANISVLNMSCYQVVLLNNTSEFIKSNQVAGLYEHHLLPMNLPHLRKEIRLYNSTNFTCNTNTSTEMLNTPLQRIFTPYLDINQVGVQIIVFMISSLIFCTCNEVKKRRENRQINSLPRGHKMFSQKLLFRPTTVTNIANESRRPIALDKDYPQTPSKWSHCGWTTPGSTVRCFIKKRAKGGTGGRGRGRGGCKCTSAL
jgi:hypothetical protein